jgi:thiamine pyrophosphokinase
MTGTVGSRADDVLASFLLALWLAGQATRYAMSLERTTEFTQPTPGQIAIYIKATVNRSVSFRNK